MKRLNLPFSRYLLCLILSLVLCSVGSNAFANQANLANLDNKKGQTERQLFLEAEKALKLGQLTKFNKLKKQLSDYPLYPYLEYKQLRNNLHRQKSRNIRNFIKKYNDTPLASRLRNAWLSRLAKTGQWQEFLKFYEPYGGETLQCHYLTALLSTGQKKKAWPLISKTWMSGKSRPKACDKAFAQWKKAGYQTTARTWQRIGLALDAGQVSLARYLARSFNKRDKQYFDQWMNIRKKPEKLSRLLSYSHPQKQRVIVQAIERLSRQDLPAAIAFWNKYRRDAVKDAALIARVERSLALRFLKDPKPEVYDYLVFSEPCEADSRLQEIRIRAALLHGEWHDILKWLNRLTPEQQKKDRWVYWRARSLQQIGNKALANQLFDQLTKKRSFYGFLAADLRNKRYAMNHSPVKVSTSLIKDLLAEPGMQRARELLLLDRLLDARREWFFMTRTLEQDELLAAAKIAFDWQWHDRAILTLSQASAWNDLNLRFPVKHKQHVEKAADQNKLTKHWIMAMIRQESAFMEDAHSSAGAMGLMQLMPATARQVARSLKLRKPKRSDLMTPAKNIRLGSAYLAQVLNRFDQNPVLAIAAYNAGPHRVSKWIPAETMPADIWIELVPYRETRNYLKSVLAYSVIYADKLGIKQFKMNQKMPAINGSKNQKLLSARH